MKRVIKYLMNLTKINKKHHQHAKKHPHQPRPNNKKVAMLAIRREILEKAYAHPEVGPRRYRLLLRSEKSLVEEIINEFYLTPEEYKLFKELLSRLQFGPKWKPTII